MKARSGRDWDVLCLQNEMVINAISSISSNERQNTWRSWSHATFRLKQQPTLPCLQENEPEVSTRKSPMEKEAYLHVTLTYLVTSTLSAFRQQMTQEPCTFWQACLCPKIYGERQMWVWYLPSPTQPLSSPRPACHPSWPLCVVTLPSASKGHGCILAI